MFFLSFFDMHILKDAEWFQTYVFHERRKIWSKGKMLRKILIFYENIGKLSKF